MRFLTLGQRIAAVALPLTVGLTANVLDRSLGRETPAENGDRKVDFMREVRPILAQHCFQCHGPDDAKRKGKLRLDVKDDVFSERKEKHIVAPGSTEGSLVFERITSENEKKKMPPVDKAEPLTQAKVDTLRLWIEQGAEWTEHWAFQAPKRSETPEVSNKGWARDPLDAFVLTRLEKEGSTPAEEATKEAWLRRASFDLTGMPPTIQELDEFAKDNSDDAYAKQADRLLASPRYGERQAQDWLDLARYADTGGYQNDSPRTVWKWREWVVKAYNANKPFDEFTIEQLAGDMLPNATLDQKVATGFNRNHSTNSEAGEEEDEYRSAYVIDRVNTTATVWMGLTLACTQCHDHKYDPISQKDYYSFYSFFNNVKERDADGFGRNPRPSIPVPNPDQAPRLAVLQSKIKSLEKRLEAEDPLSDADQKEWEKRMYEKIGKDVKWTTVEPIGMLSRNGSVLKKLDDGSILSTGIPPVKDTYEIVIQPGKRKITALRLEAIPDESLPKKASGRANDGRFILNGLEVRNSTLSESQEPPVVILVKGEADINQKVDFTDLESSFEDSPSSIDGALDVKDSKGGGDDGGMGGGRFGGGGWSLAGDAKKERHEALLLPREVLELNDASVVSISMHHTSQRKFKSSIGRFRLSYTEDEGVRTLMLPLLGKVWSSLGPFPAEDVDKVYETAFTPEADIAKGLDTKKTYPKIVLATADGKGGPGPGAGQGPGGFKGGSPGAGAGFGAKGFGGASKEGGPPKKSGDEVDKGAPGEKGKKSDDVKGPEDSTQKAPGLLIPMPPVDKAPEVKLAKAESEAPAVNEDETPKSDGQALSESAPSGKGPAGKGPGGKGFGGKGKGFGKPAPESDDGGAMPPGDGEKKFKKGGKFAVGGDEGVKDDEKGKVADGKDAKPGEKGAVKDGEKAGDDKAKEKGPRKKDEKVSWTEQSRWRDGSPARLEGTNVAYYLTRKIQSEGPRVAKLEIDGPAAVKVWLNGEPVHASAPVPPPVPKKKDTKDAAAAKDAPKDVKDAMDPKDAKDNKDSKDSKDAKDVKDSKESKDSEGDKDADKDKEKDAKEEEAEDEPEFDFADFVNGGTGRGGTKEDKSFKLGFRAGENELVVKAVFSGGGQGRGRGMGGGAAMFMGGPFGGGGMGGGGSFTFKITPEGDDVLNHEVVIALRREAEERLRSPSGGVEPVNPTEVRPAGAAEMSVKSPRQTTGGASGGTDALRLDALGNDDKPDDKKTSPKVEGSIEGKVGEIAIENILEFDKEKERAAKPKLTPPEQRKKVIREYYRTRVSFAGKAVYDEVQRLKAEETKLKREIPETMVMEERDKPRQAYIFKRGLYKNRGEDVSSDVPSVLPAMPAEYPKTRLGLAQWLVSKNHPLTPRVTVNRIWKQYFGSGLVKTHEDFGIRGQLPTHPELLDTLAVDFVESKWNLNGLHKRIVLSATYRQAALSTPEKLEKDPENTLYSRGPRMRLSAEMVRDNALSVSGLLFEKIGGESARPFQPTGISKAVTGGRDVKREKGENQYRRGLYVYWKRGAPYPSMLTFDSAKRDTCTVTRPETTTPMQSLVLLNDPVYVECAKMFGQRMLKTGGKDDAARLKFGFRLCASRLPNEQELEILQKLLKDERAHYKEEAAAAKKLLGVGDAKVDEALDAAELAAWANVGSALLNLDATIHKG